MRCRRTRGLPERRCTLHGTVLRHEEEPDHMRPEVLRVHTGDVAERNSDDGSNMQHNRVDVRHDVQMHGDVLLPDA